MQAVEGERRTVTEGERVVWKGCFSGAAACGGRTQPVLVTPKVGYWPLGEWCWSNWMSRQKNGPHTSHRHKLKCVVDLNVKCKTMKL